MRLLAPLSLPVLLLAAPAFAGQPHLAAIDAVVQPCVGRDTPGLGVLVMKNGVVLHMRGYGLASLDDKTPVDADSLFDLASVSKEMTAMAAMLQMEEGAYAPDTEIGTLLPAFADQPADARPLTISDLLHHVGGLPDYLADGISLDYEETTTNAQVVGSLARQPLVRPPGTRFDYSNSGYLVLGSLVAAADGAASLDDVLAERIFEPIGMASSGLVTSARIDKARVVTGYSGTNGDFEESSEPTVTEGDGNVLASLSDLARYEAALSTHRLLSASATARLFENGRYDDGSPVDDDGSGYGYGWVLSPGQQSYATHSGSWMGTSTYYQRNLTSGVTIILQANGEDMSHEDLASDIEDAVDDGQ